MLPEQLPADDPLAQLAQTEASEAGPTEPPTEPDPDEPQPEPDAEPQPDEEPELEPVAEDADYQTQLEAAQQRIAELNRTVGSMANEIGQWRAQAPQGQQPQTNQQVQGEPQVEQAMSREEWQDWYDQDPFAATQYLSAQSAFEMAQAMQEQYAPLVKQVNDVAASETLTKLAKDVTPEVFERNKAKLAERLRADPMNFDVDAQTRYQRMREVIYSAEYERSLQGQSRSTDRQRSSDGRFVPGKQHQSVHTEAGSTPPPAPAEDVDQSLHPIIQEMNRVRPVRDALGELPYIPPGT